MSKLIENADVETPNTANSEVKMTSGIVQPKSYNYAQTGSTQTTKPTQSTMGQVNQNSQSTMGQVNTNQVALGTPMQEVSAPTGNTIAIRKPSDFYDNTVQGYLDSYDYGVSINDYQAQINALTALDKYRVENGYKALYTADIYELNNLRNQKIQGIIKGYENQIASYMNTGDYANAELVGQELQNYKTSVNYKEPVNNSATFLGGNLEYKSDYDNVISGIVNELLTMRFTYDPSDDEALLKAQEHAINTVYESMDAKGILDSTMTAQMVTSTVANLQSVYEKMARDEFYDNLNRLQSMATFVIGLDDRQYERWVSNVQLNLEYYQAQKDEVSYQWDRVNTMGYVDNEASVVLGVPVGMLSPAKRQAIEEAEAEARKKYNELYTDLALAEAKAKLELETYIQKKAIEQSYEDGTYGEDDEQGSDTGTIDSKYKFTGELSATALKGQLSLMYDEMADDKEMLEFARDNAKNYDAYVQAIESIGYTIASANEILYPKEPLPYTDESGKFDPIAMTQGITGIYNKFAKESKSSTVYDSIVKEMKSNPDKKWEILEKHIQQGLDDETGMRLYEELQNNKI